MLLLSAHLATAAILRQGSSQCTLLPPRSAHRSRACLPPPCTSLPPHRSRAVLMTLSSLLFVFLSFTSSPVSLHQRPLLLKHVALPLLP